MFKERRKQINTILDTVPPEELAKQPLPQAFEKLPNGVYDQIKVKIKIKLTLRNLFRKSTKTRLLNGARDIRRFERWCALWHMNNVVLLSKICGSLRWYSFVTQRFSNNEFKPPPGFEAALSPTIYQQLLTVHQNPNLSVAEKKQKVDQIMQKVPADQLAKFVHKWVLDKLI